jgi:hypothetical protein
MKNNKWKFKCNAKRFTLTAFSGSPLPDFLLYLFAYTMYISLDSVIKFWPHTIKFSAGLISVTTQISFLLFKFFNALQRKTKSFQFLHNLIRHREKSWFSDTSSHYKKCINSGWLYRAFYGLATTKMRPCYNRLHPMWRVDDPAQKK